MLPKNKREYSLYSYKIPHFVGNCLVIYGERGIIYQSTYTLLSAQFMHYAEMRLDGFYGKDND